MRRTTVKYIAAGAVLLGAVGYLAYASMKDGWSSYHLKVDEFVSDAKYHDQRVRLAGAVSGDGLVCDAGRTGAHFTLLGDSQRVPVVFKGVVPDLFKAECQVVVEGRLDKDGVFRADAMMTKCASKYESGEHGKTQQKQEKNVMTAHIGNYILCAAILVAAVTLLVSLAGVRFSSQGLRRTTRRGIYLLAGLLSLASAALLLAEINSDFSIDYVARYTDRALPLGYKIAAFWAGQDGSILLWAWMVAVMSAIFVFLNRRNERDEYTTAAGVLAVVIAFFAVMMLFADANPFAVANPVPADGHGMNPMLQNPGMIAHPPVLFLGYAGFTIPFALLVGVLISRQKDGGWLAVARPWAMVSWLFLGAGIVLGAQWAYVELGWGGYWAWDPVENASLLPWLTGTALLHCLVAQRQRGTFKRWTAGLITLSFLLCILAAYITRGGVVNSVHGFPRSEVGKLILGALILGTIFSAGLLVLRWGDLKGERELDGLLSRDGGFLAGNILFVAMMGLTLIGTIYPVFRQVTEQPGVSVNTEFYNKAVLPLALGMVALMAIAPLLGYGREAAARLLRGLGVPLMAGGLAVVVMAALGFSEIWALASVVVVVVLFVTAVADFIVQARNRGSNWSENFLTAAWRLVDNNHRRYGGHIVHVGIAMIVLGVAGSSLYTVESQKNLNAGESMQVGRYTIKVDSYANVQGPNYTAHEAKLTVTDSAGRSKELRPQIRRYQNADGEAQIVSEIALDTGLRNDVFAALMVDEEHPDVRVLRVLVRPLMLWIWIGGVVMGIGTIFCLLPRFSKAAEEAIEAVPESVAAAARPRGRATAATRQVA